MITTPDDFEGNSFAIGTLVESALQAFDGTVDSVRSAIAVLSVPYLVLRGMPDNFRKMRLERAELGRIDSENMVALIHQGRYQ